MLPDPLTYSLIPERKNPSCSSYIHSAASAWRYLHYVKQSSWRSFSYQHKNSCLWATHLQLLCKPTWWPTSTLRKRLSQELTEPGTQTLLGMTNSFSVDEEFEHSRPNCCLVLEIYNVRRFRNISCLKTCWRNCTAFLVQNPLASLMEIINTGAAIWNGMFHEEMPR